MNAMDAGPPEITRLLQAWGQGDESALHRLIPLVERELNRIARLCLVGDRARHSLSATALVNEAFLRLVDIDQIDWRDRTHFLSMAARLMRRVLVDLARARQSDKRGGDVIRVSLDEDLVNQRGHATVLLELDEALQALAALDERKSRVVEMRFFGGLSIEETAEILSVSSKTVRRDWLFAKAWLQREMASGA